MSAGAWLELRPIERNTQRAGHLPHPVVVLRGKRPLGNHAEEALRNPRLRRRRSEKSKRDKCRRDPPSSAGHQVSTAGADRAPGHRRGDRFRAAQRGGRLLVRHRSSRCRPGQTPCQRRRRPESRRADACQKSPPVGAYRRRSPCDRDSGRHLDRRSNGRETGGPACLDRPLCIRRTIDRAQQSFLGTGLRPHGSARNRS